MKDSIPDNISSIVEDTEQFFEAKIELWTLKITDKVAAIISAIVSKFIFILIGVIVLVALNIAVALLIGKWLGQMYLGFLVIAGAYIFLGLILFLARKKLIENPVYSTVINLIMK